MPAGRSEALRVVPVLEARDRLVVRLELDRVQRPRCAQGVAARAGVGSGELGLRQDRVGEVLGGFLGLQRPQSL